MNVLSLNHQKQACTVGVRGACCNTSRRGNDGFENVVVAYDGSDQALAAVKKAAEIVGGEEAAKLHVVFVTTHPNAQLPANFNSASFDPQQYLLSVEDIMALYNKTIDEETEKVKEGIGDSLDSLGDKATIEVIPAIRRPLTFSAMLKRLTPTLS